ncbi:winged helix DNA-binding domain-containing protein [Corynebacterium poyangense]|uniref:Winged helix DNA-binding domain-containing protein n=1 Tax=Corynebacterium poyangense TaxID=2684405 RepID=A0A7H0SLP5_9CORY|nr:winged helix DNA-binding domain-containing protein [Corynebacterium poyangense]QNQ89470.1 winged helix DNA-binding domain-containing protein [Corynebacterium poyangense]
MGKQRMVLPLDVGLLRICAQGLVSATASSTVEDAVSRLLAVQGQQVSALPHALIARVPGARGSDVKEAFDFRTLVRHRPMRGTVHITHARDYHWMRVALKPGLSSWEKRHYPASGITEKVVTQANHLAWEIIADQGGAATRAQLFAAWDNRLNTGHLSDKASRRRWCQLLMYATMNTGALVEGPTAKNQHLFIDARALPSENSAESGFQLTEQRRQEGVVEIARRYITGHGPVTVEDFAWWAGLKKSTATSALESALDQDSSLGRFSVFHDELKPAEKTPVAPKGSETLYMSKELPDILASCYSEAAQLFFLPFFDEMYVGYANRTCTTDTEGARLICPASNGMFRPLLIHQGRVIGVRPARTPIEWLEQPTAEVVSATERLVSETLKRLAS